MRRKAGKGGWGLVQTHHIDSAWMWKTIGQTGDEEKIILASGRIGNQSGMDKWYFRDARPMKQNHEIVLANQRWLLLITIVLHHTCDEWWWCLSREHGGTHAAGEEDIARPHGTEDATKQAGRS